MEVIRIRTPNPDQIILGRRMRSLTALFILFNVTEKVNSSNRCFNVCTLQASVKALRAAQFARDANGTFQSLEDVRSLAAGQFTVVFTGNS